MEQLYLKLRSQTNKWRGLDVTTLVMLAWKPNNCLALERALFTVLFAWHCGHGSREAPSILSWLIIHSSQRNQREKKDQHWTATLH